MNLKDIVNRSNEIPIEENEAYLVIKEYIKARKKVDVNPRIESRFGTINTVREVKLMHHMLNDAIGWFRQNPECM
jgi:neutral trehalase